MSEPNGADFDDVLEMQRKIEEMEREAEKIRSLQPTNDNGGTNELNEGAIEEEDELDSAETLESDKRSVYVGQVDYGATPEELQEHFKSCGTINRITILVDKWTGSPKGYAYVEFADEDSVSNAVLLNDTMFRGRQIKVSAKRTNIPGMNRKGGKGRGKGKGAPWWMGGKGKGKGRGRGVAPWGGSAYGFRPY
jgi:polyadenylate-binding protein 2